MHRCPNNGRVYRSGSDVMFVHRDLMVLNLSLCLAATLGLELSKSYSCFGEW